jgi:hypothetical protein
MSYVKITPFNGTGFADCAAITVEYFDTDHTDDYISERFRKGDVSEIRRNREDDEAHIYFSSSIELEFEFNVLNEIDGVTFLTNEEFYDALCTAVFGA